MPQIDPSTLPQGAALARSATLASRGPRLHPARSLKRNAHAQAVPELRRAARVPASVCAVISITVTSLTGQMAIPDVALSCSALWMAACFGFFDLPGAASRMKIQYLVSRLEPATTSGSLYHLIGQALIVVGHGDFGRLKVSLDARGGLGKVSVVHTAPLKARSSWLSRGG